MSDTPETDDQPIIYAMNDLCYQVPCVDLEFARKLERERDELAALLAAEKATRNSIIEKGVQTERERDEARKHLKEIEEYGTDEVNAAVDLRRNLAQALVDLDDMQYQRDEARAERDILRLDAQREAEHHDRMVSELEKVYKERDEAREDVVKLQDIKRKHEHEELVAAQENDQLKQERDKASQQYDNLATEHMLTMNKLAEERDEALNAIHTYKCEVEAWELLAQARRERDEARARLHPDRALEWLRVHYQSWFGDRTEWSDDIADRFYKDTATLTLFCQNFKFSKEVAK
jgi:hypothetical protein